MRTRLEHVGIAVNVAAPLQELLAALLGLSRYKSESVASEHVVTHFLHAGGAKIELLESTARDSAIARFLENRGEGIHHLAFEVDDLHAVLRRAAGLGVTIINQAPKDGADGKQIFFIHPRDTHGVLIEICQSKRFAGRKTELQSTIGTLTAFEVGASGAPVLILIHDAGSSALQQFGDILPRFEGSLHAVATDIPEHDHSGTGEVRFLETAEACVSALLAHPQAGSVVVGGVGLGAFAAATGARIAPETVRGLILIDPRLPSPHEGVTSTVLPPSLDCPVMILGLEESTLEATLNAHRNLSGASLAVIPTSPDRSSAIATVISDFVTSSR